MRSVSASTSADVASTGIVIRHSRASASGSAAPSVAPESVVVTIQIVDVGAHDFDHPADVRRPVPTAAGTVDVTVDRHAAAGVVGVAFVLLSADRDHLGDRLPGDLGA